MRELRIAAVRLDRFRGATRAVELRFDPSMPIALLFGENGAGKSTVVDAIDAVCNGQPGSVRDRSSTRVSQHLPSAGARPGDVRAEVETADGTWEARLAGDTLTTTPPYAGAPVHVLRRAGLLTLVNAEPSARFAVLARFVDVGGVEACEDALATAARDASNAVARIESDLAQAERGLEELWIAAERPGATAEAWAGEQADAPRDALQADTERAHAVAQGAERLQRELDAGDAAARASGACDEACRGASAALAALSSAGAGRELVRVLGAAQSFLAQEPEPADCPVCERPIDAAGALRRVVGRLDAARALAEAVTAVETAERARQAAAATLDAARAALVDAATRLAASLTVERLDAALQPAARRLRGETAHGDALAAATTLGAQAAALRDLAHARAASLQRKLERARLVKAAYDQVVNLRETLRDALRVHGRLAEALGVVRRERTAYVQEVLDAVRDECNRLYEAIHPGEPLRLQRLRLDERRRRSLLQEAEFAGHADVPPQAYFSESHLDTFGFCFWLAATKFAARRGPPPIVALDDPFGAVDAAHAARILSLLVAERASFAQVIVATHDGAWPALVRAGAVDASVVDVVTLRAWSAAAGIGAAE